MAAPEFYDVAQTVDELKKYRIMILSPDFGYGGAERSAAAISVLLSKFSEVHFVVFNDTIKQAYSVGGTVHTLDVAGGGALLQKGINFLKRVRRVKQLKKKLDIKLCLSFLEGADYVNILSGGKEKIILSIRGSKKFDPNISGVSGWIRKSILIPVLYRRAHALVAVSQGLQSELQNNYRIQRKKPFYVIPNFYDVRELQSRALENLSAEWEIFFANNRTLITVGRLSYEKGIDRFIPVFKKILEANPETRWVILGDGPYRKSIIRMLQQKGISFSENVDFPNAKASVFFVGYQTNPLKWIKRSTLHVSSSLTEGFPNAMVEAMSVGVPVAAADCPYGPSEILIENESTDQQREYGILLPMLTDNDDVLEHWSNSLRDVLSKKDVQQHWSQQSIIRSQYYSPLRIEKMWNDMIQDMQ